MATVVIIEDDSDHGPLMRDRLEHDGHTVRLVPGAVGAVIAADADIVLLDVHLPHMSGLDICRELRRTAATADLPIVTVSAYATATDLERAHQASSSRYVKKPFRLQHLADTVAELVATS
ncbi:response regulator [Dactylosporangium sp. NPDC000521]|uniref:response regulator n=1 Tax=Dactylosporangium sp. NPDC000521 TaxID=3363975 RepID=UPI00367BFE63